MQLQAPQHNTQHCAFEPAMWQKVAPMLTDMRKTLHGALTKIQKSKNCNGTVQCTHNIGTLHARRMVHSHFRIGNQFNRKGIELSVRVTA